MSLEIDVLRALLRLARRRTAPTLAQVVDRVRADGDEPAVRAALTSLARSGLVQRSPAGLRLSLAGLAVAVACAQRPTRRPKAATRIAAVTRSTEAAVEIAPPTEIGQRRSGHRAA